MPKQVVDPFNRPVQVDDPCLFRDRFGNLQTGHILGVKDQSPLTVAVKADDSMYAYHTVPFEDVHVLKCPPIEALRNG